MARNVEFNEDIAIQKAMEVFWEKGYYATSMRDLTAVMKINSSSLYNTIGDKHQLFLKCIDHYIDLKKNNLTNRIIEGKSPLKILSDFLDDSVAAIANDINPCMVVKTAFEVAQKDKTVQLLLQKDTQFTHNFLVDLIEKAVASKEMSGHTSPAVLADFLISSFSGWYEMYLINRDFQQIKNMAAYILQQILK
jgi:TetR/AcrR family transcriptional repressor of nem operon